MITYQSTMRKSGTPAASTSDKCECTFGLLNPPPPNPNVPLYEARVNQYMRGELVFCPCDLGKGYQAYVTKGASEYKTDGQMLEEQRRNQLWKNAGVPPMYAGMTLGGYVAICDKDSGKQEAIKALLSLKETAEYQGKMGLLLWGKPGVGKTGAVSPLFIHLLREGCSGLWIQYSELMARLRDFESDDNRRVMADAKKVEYLFIDDIGDPGAEKSASDYARDCVFRIIDHRKNNGLPILATSNLNLAGLEQQFHERIAQRLGETCSVIEVKGKVLRK